MRAYLRESLAFMSKPQVESWPTEATSGGRGAGVGMAFLSAYTTEEEGENQGGRATQGVATACESKSREPRPLEGTILGSIAPSCPSLLTVNDEEKRSVTALLIG